MYLRVNSPDNTIFEGEITKVVVPTMSGEIGILPGHIPLTSVVVPGLLKIFIPEHHEEGFLKDKDFLYDNGAINISVSKGLLFVDGNNIIIATSAACSNPTQTQEVLEKMKEKLEHDIKSLRAEGSLHDLEKAIIDLQKVEADLKLFKMKGYMK